MCGRATLSGATNSPPVPASTWGGTSAPTSGRDDARWGVSAFERPYRERRGSALDRFDRCRSVVTLQGRPAVGVHPFRPAAVGPELSMLVNAGVDHRRAPRGGFDRPAPQVHRKIKRIAAGDDPAGLPRALIPVLAVILFQHPGWAERMVGAVDCSLSLFWRVVLIDQREPPDLGFFWPLGQPQAELRAARSDPEVREDIRVPQNVFADLAECRFGLSGRAPAKVEQRIDAHPRLLLHHRLHPREDVPRCRRGARTADDMTVVAQHDAVIFRTIGLRYIDILGERTPIAGHRCGSV